MFINDEAQKLALPIVAKTTVAPATGSQQRGSELLQLNPGQQVKAEIIANLPNNLFLARIAGKLYQLEIPLNVQPGESMEMTFISADPRLTFQVLRPPQGGASVELSPMTRWLAAVVSEAPPVPRAGEPLLESPAQGGELLATRLSDAIRRSGLFYESHLAQWAAGTFQLRELLKEPQGRLSFRTTGSDEEGEGAADAAFADARTLPLVKEQLMLMTSGVLGWKGEAWPGQGVQISVRDQAGEGEEPGMEATLSLQLPELGAVEAKVRLAADGVRVELVCGKAGSAAQLKKGGEELRSALAGAGLRLNRMAARDDRDSD